MRSVEFTEDELSNLDLVRQRLFEDALDPRSNAYVRTLNRPRIHWLRILLLTLLPLAVLTALGVGLFRWGVPAWACVLLPSLILLVYGLAMAKSAALCMIRIYQRYAPASIRNKCRFEPSCSEYALGAIEKYGLIRGIPKACNRLGRCKVDNGGYDYP